jgi:hypothetical protein
VTAVKGGLESALSNEVSGTPISDCLIDQVGGTFIAALGWAKLVSTWNTNVLRLRRTDNNENDFGLSGKEFDAAAANTWIGANSAWGRTWYDQSGGGTNFLRTAAAYQPPGSEIGVLVPGATAGKYAWRTPCTPGNPGVLYINANITPADGIWSFVFVGVDDGTDDSTHRAIFRKYNTGGALELYRYSDVERLAITNNGSAQKVVNNACPLGSWFVAVGVFNGASSILRVNGVEQTGDISPNWGSSFGIDIGFHIGRYSLFAMQAGAWDEATRIKAETAAKLATGVTW